MPERLVLVHGLAGSDRWWRPVVPYLGEYALRYVDPREELVAEPDETLVGHSLGGLHAARYAAEHEVRRLVLVAPVGLPRIQPLGLIGSTVPRHYARVWIDALRWGPVGLLRGGLEAMRTRLDPSPIAAPTLIVWGAHDRLVPARLAREWHAAIPISRVELISRARHVPMVEQPSAFAQVLLDFLRDG